MDTSAKKIDFINLKTQQEEILPALMAGIKSVLAHGQYIMGPEVRELENRLAEYVGVKHALSCSSGTDALLMTLMAYGVGPGDAIFTTPFTFVATAEVIQFLGATSVFVDVDPHTFNIDPEALEQTILQFYGKHKTKYLRPKGIIPVDLFGQPADYDRINELGRRHKMFVLADAAQSFGAMYKGRRTGSLAQVTATSFFPAKPLGCYGDGGAIFTDDDRLAEILSSIRVHGQGSNKYENVRLGINGRLDTLQAAVLLAKLDVFDQEVLKRQAVAQRYRAALARVVEVPYVAPDRTSVWAQYSVLSDRRGILQERLKQEGIPTAIYYPIPLHLQNAFKHLGYKAGDFPVSERLASKIFSLPMSPYLSKEDQERIIQVIVNIE